MANNTRIHFIGTVHTDPFGSERLWRALKYDKPDAIAVECSPEMWNYIESGQWFENYKLVLEEARKMGLDDSAYNSFLEEAGYSNFEIKVSVAYGRTNNIPVHLVDSSMILDKTLGLSSGDILRNAWLLNGVKRPDPEKPYNAFDEIFRRSDPLALECEYFVAKGCEKDYCGRDDYAEQKIREVVQDGMKLGVVYGLAHCLHDKLKRSLFSRLQDFNPSRATLKWYEME